MINHRRVLIVEDDRIVQMHLRLLVNELGYAVSGVASTAEEALASAEASAPNLVLMDVRLPGARDGIEAARELRARHDVGVVFVTAYADEDTVGRAQEVGALGYVVKPFSTPQLRAALSTACGEHQRARRIPGTEPTSDPMPPSVAGTTVTVTGASSGERSPFGAGTRMAIFTHDTLGLGHLQRSLNIARALTAHFPGLSVLLLTGSPAVHRFALPTGVDYIKLPAVRKVAAEHYEARSLLVDDDAVLRLRTNILLSSLQDYDPHVLLVDHAPIGMKGELRPALEWLHRHRPDCVKLLGLRDVLDDPESVRALWQKQGIHAVLRDFYQHVLIYGSQDVFDSAAAYGMADDVRAKVLYCDYIAEFSQEWADVPGPTNGKKLVVVTIGGGEGGERLISSFLDLLARSREVDFETILITGPFLPPEVARHFRERCAGLPATLLEFVPSTSPYMDRADLVVCTGGYNTMVQALRFAKKALVVPRVMHRNEQLIRARRLEALGLVTMLHPEQLSAERLSASISTLLAEPSLPLVEARARSRIRFDGTARVVELCSRLRVSAPGAR